MQNGSSDNETLSPPRAYSVTALIDFEAVVFELGRDRASSWRMQKLFRLGSPFAQFQAFSVGSWNVDDVRTVLVEAYAGNDEPAQFVERLLVTMPVGRLAPLAIRVLEAFLFGIPAERAHYDAADPFDEIAA